VDANFDLFGNPVRAGKGRPGRPRFEATEKDRNKVKLLLALGWSNERVANAIGASLASLKRYFRAELKVRGAMRDRLDARRLELAMEMANDRNVAALKELGKMIERSDMARLNDRFSRRHRAGDDGEAPDPKPPLGKRAAALEAAKEVPEDYGDIFARRSLRQH
jgi:hypothetical protein